MEPEDEQSTAWKSRNSIRDIPKPLRIAGELEYELVRLTIRMLGYILFPGRDFRPVQNNVIRHSKMRAYISANTDRLSFPHENQPTRKPGTVCSPIILGGSDLEIICIGDR
jgi:hypothetical protein